MKHLVLSTVLVFFMCAHLDAQFQRSYGTEEREIGRSVQLTSHDAGYIIGGITSKNFLGNGDATLVKTDANGSPIWSKVYGGSRYDDFQCVRQLTSAYSAPRGYVAVGQTQSFGFGGGDVYFVRVDNAGTPVVSRVYGGTEFDRAFCIQPVKTPKGPGFVIVGETRSFSSLPDVNVYVILTDEWGKVIHSVVLGYKGGQRGYWIEQTSDGGYILVGSNTLQCGINTTQNFYTDIYAVKLKSDLSLVWDRIIGGGPNLWNRHDIAYSVKENPLDKSFAITGRTHSFSQNTRSEVFLLNLSSTGGFNFLRTYGLVNQDQGHSILLSKNPFNNSVDYVIAGYTNSAPLNNRQALMFKTNMAGNPYWFRTYGLDGSEIAYEVHYAKTPHQTGLVFTGSVSSFGAGSSDIYLVETDFNGKSHTICEKEIEMALKRHEPCISKSTKYFYVKPEEKIASLYKEVEYKKDKCHLTVPPPIVKSAEDNMTEPSDIRIAPNPVKDVLQIINTKDYKDCKVNILNIQGKQVGEAITIDTESRIELQIESLPQGLYFVEIKSVDNSQFKLLKFSKY